MVHLARMFVRSVSYLILILTHIYAVFLNLLQGYVRVAMYITKCVLEQPAF
jgi:hypothetical protein